MSKIRGRLLVLYFVLGWQSSTAQPRNVPHAGGHVRDRLQMVVILSRHGVRSPTWTQARLNAYSALPWPNWSVPPGYLTGRGFELVKLFGSYDRASLAETGLIAAHGCADADRTYIWADTDQRTLESGRALAEGLFPGCPPPVHSLAAGVNDPLFHPASDDAKPTPNSEALPEFEAEAKQPDAQQDELLQQMQRVLSGCSPKTSCTPVHDPKMPLLEKSAGASRGENGRSVDSHGSLAQASSFAEDFLLEYAEGLPGNQIGWGNVDERQLRRFLRLHLDYFNLMHRTPELARIEASNMLFHIERTLEQGVEQRPVANAAGPVNSKVVILAGHDTNIAAVAALLGLHWTLDGRSDDTPPGTQLSFELWRNDHGAWSVRVTVAMQTLNQLRTMQVLTRAAPPVHETLKLKGCTAETSFCAWDEFRQIADAAIDKDDVVPAQAN